ncbi:MAG: hypothetical protein K2X50_09360 [Gammaproteobacteria bacterium]|nr:hypothetical protein [Gammaproteobacteria bacterium]
MRERLLPEQYIHENRARGNRFLRIVVLAAWFSLTLIIFPIRAVIAIFTEFLPLLLSHWASKQLIQLSTNLSSDHTKERVFHSKAQILSYTIRIILLAFLFTLMRCLHLLGSAITSPIRSYKDACYLFSSSLEFRAAYAVILSYFTIATVWSPIFLTITGVLFPTTIPFIMPILVIEVIVFHLIIVPAILKSIYSFLYEFNRIRGEYFEYEKNTVISFNQNIANLRAEINPTIVVYDRIIINYATAQITKETVTGSHSPILTLTLYREIADNTHVLKFPLQSRNPAFLTAESEIFNCSTESLCTIDQGLRQTIGEKLFFLAVALGHLKSDNNLIVYILKYVIPNTDQNYLAAVVTRARITAREKNPLFFQPVLINNNPGRDQTDKVTMVDDNDLLQPLLQSTASPS